MRTWTSAVALVACCLGMAGKAEAQSRLLLFADTSHVGRIQLSVQGPPGADVQLSELIRGRLYPVARTRVADDGFRIGILRRPRPWRCDRRVRQFVAQTRLEDGSIASGTYPVRTPSCRRRLSLSVSRRARVGGTVAIRIRDRWRLTDSRARLCTQGAGTPRRCRRVRAPGRLAVRTAARGTLRVTLQNRWQRARQVAYVGVRPPRGGPRVRLPSILVTGDSLAELVASYVGDRLRRRAAVHPDVRPATGLSRPGFDWMRHARRQSSRLRPRATVLFVGANDGYPMRTPDGARVACCDEGWRQEYARRVGAIMRAFSRNGRGRVVWILLPAARDAARSWIFLNVDEAVRRAAAANPNVELIHLDELFSPGFTYRRTLRIGGRLRVIRDPDGLHLSPTGAAILARLLDATLRANGAL